MKVVGEQRLVGWLTTAPFRSLASVAARPRAIHYPPAPNSRVFRSLRGPDLAPGLPGAGLRQALSLPGKRNAPATASSVFPTSPSSKAPQLSHAIGLLITVRFT